MNERDQLLQYVDARKTVGQIEDNLKTAKAKLYAIEKDLIEGLIDREATATAKYPGLGSATLLRPKLRASYLKENEGLIFDFIRQEEYGDIIQPTVHHATFSKFVKEILDEGKEIPIQNGEPIVKYYLDQKVRLNSAQ